MKPIRRVFFIAVLLPAMIAAGNMRQGVATAFAQSEPAPPSELETLKADLEKIKSELRVVRKELTLIRQLLSQRGRRPNQPSRVVATVRTSDHPTAGKKDAPITMIEFSDYQCPFCGRFFRDTLPALKAEYINTGKVRYVFRDFPLDRIHPHARKAAEAAHCAGDQGRYWDMHDLLFQNQRALQVEHLKAYARRLDLDSTAFDACLKNGTHAAEVQQNLEEGLAAGIRGTPGFFLGKTRSDNTIQGVLISGAHPFPVFRQAVENLLRED
ncbi:MAG: DsbA family protein [Candidatus Methylomirabilales bacterium]